MKNLFGYYLKSCREEKGLSLRDFGALCHLSHTHIDSLEKGKDFRTGKKVSPTQETIEKIANGLMIREQILFNLSLEKVNLKFNCFLNYKEREEIKTAARNILNDPQSQEKFSTEQLIKYQEDIFIALFSRSVEASDFDIEHIDFNTYVSMLLYQEQFKSKINKDLYDVLVKKYGTTKGISENTTQYITVKRVFVEQKIAQEPPILKKYNELNTIGQCKTDAYVDGLLEHSTYRKDGKNPVKMIAKSAAFGGASKTGEITKNDVNQLVDELENPIE